MPRVPQPIGYSATYLAVGLSLVPQILIVRGRPWEFVVGCPAAFFTFIGVFGLTLPLLSSRSRRSYRARGSTDRTIVALFGTAVAGIVVGVVALAIRDRVPREAVALLAAALTVIVVVALRRTPTIQQARAEFRRHS